MSDQEAGAQSQVGADLDTAKKPGIDHDFHKAKFTFFNDGTAEGKNTYALILKELEGGNLNLKCIVESGEDYVKNNVPRREFENYENENDGDTYHNKRIAD